MPVDKWNSLFQPTVNLVVWDQTARLIAFTLIKPDLPRRDRRLYIDLSLASIINKMAIHPDVRAENLSHNFCSPEFKQRATEVGRSTFNAAKAVEQFVKYLQFPQAGRLTQNFTELEQ